MRHEDTRHYIVSGNIEEEAENDLSQMNLYESITKTIHNPFQANISTLENKISCELCYVLLCCKTANMGFIREVALPCV